MTFEDFDCEPTYPATPLAEQIRETLAPTDDDVTVFVSPAPDGTAKFHVMCSDFFWWACADAEVLTEAQIPLLRQCVADVAAAWRHGPATALLLFCSRVRSMRPQTPYYKLLPEQTHALFNACGPARTDA